MLLSSAIFNIELSTWLGPAFKYQSIIHIISSNILIQQEDLIVDSKFIRNYVLAERLIVDIIERFDIASTM